VTAGDRRAAAADHAAPGRLFVVATPIGNLADLSLRAIEVLGEVGLIAAEDTRLTRRLLDRHAIATPMISYHARSGPGRARALIDRLRAGEDVAVVTDAGTPGVSDPGEDLVAAWAAEGGKVVPIPGASAVLAAVAASGVAGPRWAFEGFLPRTGGERRDRLVRIASDPRATILYEAPGRVAATLRDLAAACGRERPGAICRELTKLHEEILRGTLPELAELAASGRLTLRGEFTLVVGAARSEPVREAEEGAIAAARAEVQRRIDAGVSRADAARQVAAETALPRRALYAAPDRREPTRR
jgi:16S rRNA (cytidine1402-2'-O)-methyltransferase